jgi:hypothetical protein
VFLGLIYSKKHKKKTIDCLRSSLSLWRHYFISKKGGHINFNHKLLFLLCKKSDVSTSGQNSSKRSSQWQHSTAPPVPPLDDGPSRSGEPGQATTTTKPCDPSVLEQIFARISTLFNTELLFAKYYQMAVTRRHALLFGHHSNSKQQQQLDDNETKKKQQQLNSFSSDYEVTEKRPVAATVTNDQQHTRDSGGGGGRSWTVAPKLFSNTNTITNGGESSCFSSSSSSGGLKQKQQHRCCCPSTSPPATTTNSPLQDFYDQHSCEKQQDQLNKSSWPPKATPRPIGTKPVSMMMHHNNHSTYYGLNGMGQRYHHHHHRHNQQQQQQQQQPAPSNNNNNNNNKYVMVSRTVSSYSSGAKTSFMNDFVHGYKSVWCSSEDDHVAGGKMSPFITYNEQKTATATTTLALSEFVSLKRHHHHHHRQLDDHLVAGGGGKQAAGGEAKATTTNKKFSVAPMSMINNINNRNKFINQQQHEQQQSVPPVGYRSANRGAGGFSCSPSSPFNTSANAPPTCRYSCFFFLLPSRLTYDLKKKKLIFVLSFKLN